MRIYLAGAFLAASLQLGCNRAAAPAAAPGTRRIVVMAPAAAEMLDALGAAGQVVGVGDWVLWPPYTNNLPRVGAYDSPSVEAVLSLHADTLITAASKAAGQSNTRLEALGVRVLEIKTNSYEGVLGALRQLGALVAQEEKARGLEARMRATIEALRARAEGAPRKRVLVVVGRDPLYVAGPGSHFDEMLGAVGGVNVMADAAANYQMVSIESVLERLPEVIIDSSDNRPDAPRGRRGGPWGQWPFLPAVKENRVYCVDPARTSVPGIRIPEITEFFGKMIHPEIFGEAAPEEFDPPTERPAGSLSRPPLLPSQEAAGGPRP